MAIRALTPEEQVMQAVQPALNYQPDAYDIAEAQYYQDQDRLMAGLGKGKEAYIAPFPQREQPVELAPADITIDTPVPQAMPTPESTPTAPGMTQRALTPCDLGMCEGRISMGNTGSGYNNSSLYTNGTTTLVTGPGLGGRSRLSQLAGAGFLAQRGATPQQVEAQNRGLDVERFTNTQRSPEWASAYADAFAQTRSPQMATAAANNHMATLDPTNAGLYYRQQLPLDSAATGDAIRQYNTQAMMTGDYTRADAFAGNPVSAVPVVEGYSVGDNGTVTMQGNLAGRDFTNQGADLSALGFGVSLTTPQQAYQLQQAQAQQAQARQTAQAKASQQVFENTQAVAETAAKLNPTTRPITDYQQQSLELRQQQLQADIENNNTRNKINQQRADGQSGDATGTPQAPGTQIAGGPVIAPPTAYTPPTATPASARPATPATQARPSAPAVVQPSTPLPAVSDKRAPTSTQRTVAEVNASITKTQSSLQTIQRGIDTPANRRRLQRMVDDLAYLQKELPLAQKNDVANAKQAQQVEVARRASNPWMYPTVLGQRTLAPGQEVTRADINKLFGQ